MSWKENWKRWIEDWKNFIILVILALVVLYLGVRTFPNNPQMVVAVLGLFFTLIGIVFYGTAVPTISPQIMTGAVGVTKDNPPNLFIDTRVIITNVSRFPARAYVNLNLEFNGKPIPTPDSYDGRRPWSLYPHEGINGHFETTLEKEKIKINSKLTMTIKIRNAGFSRYIIKYPTGHWHFDFQKNEWYNKDFGYYA